MNSHDSEADDFNGFVEQLNQWAEAKAADYGEPKGLLYQSINIVSEKYNKDPKKFLEIYKIKLLNDQRTDNNNLRDIFGLSDFVTLKIKNSFISYGFEPCTDYLKLNIICALAILPRLPQKSSQIIQPTQNIEAIQTTQQNVSIDQKKDVNNINSITYQNKITSYKNDITNSKLIHPTPRNPLVSDESLSLGLVIKGNELNNFSNDQQLLLPEINLLIERSSYFLCLLQKEMKNVQSQLNLQIGEIDRDSDQQVFVAVCFKHHNPAGSLINFKAKLELMQFLRDCKGTFKIGNIQTLAKVSGLGKLGFIRS